MIVPEPYPNTIWTREEWRKARDDKAKNGAAVPQGAAKVSIGDALDKFHKANKKGLAEGLKALTALEAALDTYQKTVKTKYPKWYARVDKVLAYSIQTFKNNTKLLPVAAKKYPTLYKSAVGALREVVDEFKASDASKKFKPKNDKAIKKALDDYLQVLVGMPYWSDKITSDQAKAAQRVITRAVDGLWDAATIEGLQKVFKSLPPTV